MELFRQCWFCGISYQWDIIFVFLLNILFVLHTDEPTVQVTQSSYIANYSSSVTLGCTVTSVLSQTSVQWFRLNNNQYKAIILSSNKYDGSTVSSPSLKLHAVSYTDAGQYVCTATNTNGTGLSTPTLLAVMSGKNLMISRQFQKPYFKKLILFTSCIWYPVMKELIKINVMYWWEIVHQSLEGTQYMGLVSLGEWGCRWLWGLITYTIHQKG